jgi:predicted dinucleotide-binding enzyme
LLNRTPSTGALALPNPNITNEASAEPIGAPRIGILGTGAMATAVGRRFVQSGCRVYFGSRTAERAIEVAIAFGGGASGGTYADAAAHGDIAVVALDWPRVIDVVRDTPSLRDRVLIDCSNPEGADGRSLAVGYSTSGAEEIARAAPGARVVKALNHVYAELLDARGATIVTVLCGDDADAVASVDRVLRRAGIEPIAGGPLRHARYVEPFAMLMVHLVRSGQLQPERATVRFGH